MILLLARDCTQGEQILQEPRGHESHTSAAPDVAESSVPGHVLQSSARIGAAQELYGFIEVE